MDHPPRSGSAQRRTMLVAFLVLLSAVMVLTVIMVLPYVLAVIMGGILAVLSQPVFQWLTGHHVTPRVAAGMVVLGVVLVLMAPLAFFLRFFRPLSPSRAVQHILDGSGDGRACRVRPTRCCTWLQQPLQHNALN